MPGAKDLSTGKTVYFRWRTICSYEIAFDKDVHCYGDEIFIQFDNLLNSKALIAIGSQDELTPGTSKLKYYQTDSVSKLTLKYP